MKVDRCQHAPCGRPFPPNTDRRKRFCDDVCRQAANRLKRAAERAGGSVVALAPRTPENAAAGDSSRAEDLRDIWARLVASIAAHGVLVPGSAGAPVAHPALRYVASLDAVLRAHESGGSVDGTTDDEYEAVKRRAMAELRRYESENAS
ncbi:hypothetical protein [Streptomyces hirsutus]|uniref:hypothetical protein n=1 Tax=Streptomyces hirsutus TaxID=35620 RepID=UPI00364994A8